MEAHYPMLFFDFQKRDIKNITQFRHRFWPKFWADLAWLKFGLSEKIPSPRDYNGIGSLGGIFIVRPPTSAPKTERQNLHTCAPAYGCVWDPPTPGPNPTPPQQT